MSEADATLYHMPGACSRVSLNALEEIGAPYSDIAINLMIGAQKSAAYLQLNPKGKVPVLVDGDQVLTETPVILHHLHQHHPEAQLLPHDTAGALSDLVWCGGFLHPLAHRIFRPAFYAPEAPGSAKDAAVAQLDALLPPLAYRLGSNPWWYGQLWSIMDVYLCWIMSVAQQAGFPLDPFPAIIAHTERVKSRPSYSRALQRERDAVARDAIALPPGFTL